jgi:hypothetical protein
MKINESSDHEDVVPHSLRAPSRKPAKKYFCPM